MIHWLMDLTRKGQIDIGVYSYTQVFDQLAFRSLLAAVLAFAFVLILARPVIAWLKRKKIGDTGMTDAAGLSATAQGKKNTPTMGGILIVGSILASTILLGDVSNFYIILGIIVMLWLAVLGGFDDWLKLTAASRKTGSRQGLYSWEKLAFQLGLSILIGYFLYNHGLSSTENNIAHVLNLPFQKTYEPGTRAVATGLIYLPRGLFIVMAIMMIAGMSNAVNISDGMDGLATGVSATVAIGLTILCFIAGSLVVAQYLLVPHIGEGDEMSVMAGAMAGACLGFLWFNCSPAAVFMGDTGSLALGGLIGYTALVIRQELVVAFMGMVFLIEIGSVVLQVGYFKATKGKRIFKCAPFHHHLHMSAWPEQQIVSRFWIMSVLLVVIALASLKLR